MSWRLRGRALLAAWFEVIVVVVVIAVLLGAWGTYATHVDPGMTTEERVESNWATEGTFEHGATVTESNPIYPTDTTLENRSIYPAAIAPQMDGRFAFRYEASESGELDVEVDLSVHRRAIVETEDTEDVVWERREEIETDGESSLDPGAELTESFELSFSAIGSENEEIEEAVGDLPGEIETALRADVRVSGTVNGEAIDDRWTYSMLLSADGDAYRVSEPPSGREAFESTASVPVERSYSPIRSVGAPLLLVGSLALLGGLVLAKRRGLALDDVERASLAYRDDREDLEEWIATMSLPDPVVDTVDIEAASLADLVDFAIDTDSGVVYDPDREVYVVVHRDVTYAYQPPSDDRGDRES
ncbi:MAG: DUF5305 family protein [Halobacteriota archaeon]|uniref:DUF5305 family protein n=1 Tax=Natronomonas sp. TaxID=2184060 RepID=UPI0039752F5A